MQIGWIQDTHTHTDANANTSGAQQELVADYDYLVNNIGVSTIYHGGDVVHSDAPAEEGPHVSPSAYEQFFSLIEQTADPSALERLIPGNHDVPLSTFLAADERCVLRDRINYPNNNLTALFLNTQATGFVTGSAGRDGQGGVGTEVCRVPKADVGWLDSQLADANSQGNAVLVIPHAALHPLPSCPWSRAQGYNGQIDSGSLYNIVTNYRDVHGVLANHASDGLNIVVPVSHLYYFGGEGSQTIDGVHYIYKKHYWKGADDSIHTFAHIDMDGTGAIVTTVEHESRSTTTALDVTF